MDWRSEVRDVTREPMMSIMQFKRLLILYIMIVMTRPCFVYDFLMVFPIRMLNDVQLAIVLLKRWKALTDFIEELSFDVERPCFLTIHGWQVDCGFSRIGPLV